jgi:hypothetical protein
MKRRSFLLTPALAAAGAQYKSGAAWVASRPRLYFDAKAVDRIRRGATAGGDLQDRWTAVLDSARRLLETELVPEEIAERGGGQHANYGAPGGQISNMGLTLGLAWHITGEKQFAEKLRQTMLAYAGYKRWYGQGLDDRVPPWHSELNTARFCFGFAAGYDALHGYLSAADRAQIGGAIVRLGILSTLDDWILPERRIHALDSMGHNWWSVCVAMAGVAALAMLGDDERAPEWLDRIQHGFERWFDYRGNVLQNKAANFDRHGAFYESLGYTNYALSEYLRYRLAYANVFPGAVLPRFPALEKTTEFFVQTLYPASSSFWTPSIGDGSIHQSGAQTVRLLVELGFDHPAAGWYLAKTRAAGRGDALELLFRKPASIAAIPESMATSAWYPDIGWAALRNSWHDDATFLAVKCGMTWNHAHADAGSFVLYHGGAPLIVDSGTCGYDNPAYNGYYAQSRAHNVILFNGKGEPEEDHLRGAKFPGRLPASLDGLGVKYVYADSTGPTARYFCRNYRHWLWINDTILIFDDVLAHEAGRLDWLLHYEGSAETSENRVTIVNGDATADMHFLYPARLAMREEEGLADHQPNRKLKYLALACETGFRDQKFVTAIVPHPRDRTSQTPRIELLPWPESSAGDQEIRGAPSGRRSISPGPDQIGVRIWQGSEVTDVYLNVNADGRRMHVNTNNILGGWDTDAYLLAVTRPASSSNETPENATRYFVACGSYLRQAGRVVLSSLAKVDAAVRPAGTTEVAVRAQQAVDLEIMVAGATGAVTVNGATVPARFDKARRLTRFRLHPPAAKG